MIFHSALSRSGTLVKFENSGSKWSGDLAHFSGVLTPLEKSDRAESGRPRAELLLGRGRPLLVTRSAIMLAFIRRNRFGGPNMGWIRICTNISAATAAIMLSSSVQLYAAQVLITDDEAKLPSPKGAIAVDNRGITRGPRIELVSGNQPIHSPTHLLVKFTSYGGAKIDADSVKVTYLKSPIIDLTPRLKQFLQPTGIDMPEAELPAGDHTVRVDLRDSDGRAASTMFVLKVVR